MALNRAGMARPSQGIPRSSRMEPQARKVAKAPTAKSRGSAPAKLMLNSRQPMVRPGTAAGVKNDSTHRASDARNWMAQVAELGISRFCRWVRAKYMAAMMAAWVMEWVLRFIGFLLRENKKWA